MHAKLHVPSYTSTDVFTFPAWVTFPGHHRVVGGDLGLGGKGSHCRVQNSEGHSQVASCRRHAMYCMMQYQGSAVTCTLASCTEIS